VGRPLAMEAIGIGPGKWVVIMWDRITLIVIAINIGHCRWAVKAGCSISRVVDWINISWESWVVATISKISLSMLDFKSTVDRHFADNFAFKTNYSSN